MTVVSSIANVAGDLLCAYVFKGGMLGMALATSFSYAVSTMVMLGYYFKGESTIKFIPKKAELSAVREVIVVGLPSALSKVCATMRGVLFNWLVLTISTQVAVSVLAIRNNLSNLYGTVGFGIGMSTLVIGGVVVGEGSRKDTGELLKTSIKYSLELNLIIGVIVILFAKQLVGVYTTDPAEVKIAVQALFFSVLNMPFATINVVFMNYFQSTKNMKLANLVCLLDNFVLISLSAVGIQTGKKECGRYPAYSSGAVCSPNPRQLQTLRSEEVGGDTAVVGG